MLNRGGAKRLFPKNGNLQLTHMLSSETRKVELEKKILKMSEPQYNGKLLFFLNFDLYCVICEKVKSDKL